MSLIWFSSVYYITLPSYDAYSYYLLPPCPSSILVFRAEQAWSLAQQKWELMLNEGIMGGIFFITTTWSVVEKKNERFSFEGNLNRKLLEHFISHRSGWLGVRFLYSWYLSLSHSGRWRSEWAVKWQDCEVEESESLQRPFKLELVPHDNRLLPHFMKWFFIRILLSVQLLRVNAEIVRVLSCQSNFDEILIHLPTID